MAKSKAPTPQEIYRAKKQQEEQERLSLLPPGLVNHGNTCFMNSVLQGLIATRLLSQLVHFEPIPPQVQEHSSTLLASQRSPQLTNGHELGGIYEQKWDNSMPIGDVFISIMYRAWEAQRLRKRESMSPRPLLTALGRKYDQYMDFAQQDAHEFLRILLDAMRMEELDVIKKRQPPSPANKRQPRRRSTITPLNVHPAPNESDHDSEDQSTQLTSLSDMLFGGHLTSILVCQTCKNVSQTYEDFNDLSLSIKAEDYAKEKKRDKFKKFARKMVGGKSKRNVPGIESFRISPSDLVISPPLHPEEHQPSSSPTPHTSLDAQTSSGSDSFVPPIKNTNDIVHHEHTFSPDASQRRSLDGSTNVNPDTAVTDDDDDDDAVIVDVATDNESAEKHLPHPPGLGPPTPDEKRLEFADAPNLVRFTRSKDRDGWARIGRRISMSVGIGKKGKEKEKERTSRPRTRRSIDSHSESQRSPMNSTAEPVQQPEIRLSRPSLSQERPQSTPPIFLKRAITSQDQITLKKLKPRPQSLTPSPSESAIPSLNGIHGTTRHHQHRSQSPKPPKPSKAEEEYLRAILADIHTAPASGANPFDFLTHWTHSSAGDDSQATSSSVPASSSSTSLPSPSPAAAWLAKLGQLPLPGIEECLRMFTAVEVLNGENMVGCRRCWKLANGWYEERKKKRRNRRGSEMNREKDGEGEDDAEDSEDGDSEEDDSEHESEDEDVSPATSASIEEEPENTGFRKTSSAPASPTLTHNQLSSFSSPTLGLYAHRNTSDAFSVISSPPDVAGSINTNMSSNVPSQSLSDMNTQNLQASTTYGDAATGVSEGPRFIPLIRTTQAEEEGRLSPSLPTAKPENQPFSRQSELPTPAFDVSATAEGSHELLLSVPTSPKILPGSDVNASSKTDDDSDGGESDITSISTAASAVQSVESLADTSMTDPSTTPSAVSFQTDGSTGQQHDRAFAVKPQTPPTKNGAKKSKPVIMRPAYKRYLIATPPPVLVIHLKRFQQTSKNPVMSFSSGFKKLEDYVAFPEYFDLTPFLAPKKEDFGLGRWGKKASGSDGVKRKSKGDKERCMYRLYAVVVHIGNMLGGHYISYTALPNLSDLPAAATQAEPMTNLPPPPAGGPRQWAYISDTVVRLTTLEEVLKAKAYICMYERI